jgi:hypothetical protein
LQRATPVFRLSGKAARPAANVPIASEQIRPVRRQPLEATPQAITPAPSAAPQQPHAPATPSFLFDAFEERAGAADNETALTQRIDEILREQARRQGVDLT